jgi:hypothetical protein
MTEPRREDINCTAELIETADLVMIQHGDKRGAFDRQIQALIATALRHYADRDAREDDAWDTQERNN